MRTHEKVVQKLMGRPGVRAEVERLEREEFALLDVLLKARHEAGLSQVQLALRVSDLIGASHFLLSDGNMPPCA